MSGFKIGDKCPCIASYPHAGVLEAKELAQPGCELCGGTGKVDIDFPEVVVESDYNGYFERLTNELLARAAKMAREDGLKFQRLKVVVTAGPLRPDALTINKDAEALYFDFYSALRSGFGMFTQAQKDAAARYILE